LALLVLDDRPLQGDLGVVELRAEGRIEHLIVGVARGVDQASLNPLVLVPHLLVGAWTRSAELVPRSHGSGIDNSEGSLLLSRRAVVAGPGGIGRALGPSLRVDLAGSSSEDLGVGLVLTRPRKRGMGGSLLGKGVDLSENRLGDGDLDLVASRSRSGGALRCGAVGVDFASPDSLLTLTLESAWAGDEVLVDLQSALSAEPVGWLLSVDALVVLCSLLVVLAGTRVAVDIVELPG
jgi:hypothetical protein